MSEITQSAGLFTITVSPPTPRWIEITMSGNGKKREIHGASIADLHDLRYCIDRVLAKIEGKP